MPGQYAGQSQAATGSESRMRSPQARIHAVSSSAGALTPAAADASAALSAVGAEALASTNAYLLAATGLSLAQAGGLLGAAVVGAVAMRVALGRSNDQLRKERDDAVAKETELKASLDKAEQQFFEADLAFEAESSALKKEFDTTLKVRVDTLRGEISREKDAAVRELKEAQETQLDEMRDYYTGQYSSKVNDLQKEIADKDATIDAQAAELARFRRAAGFDEAK